MIQKASDYLVGKFKENGVTVMRYDSKSKNSVYLKLDEGVLRTVRISKHIGNNKLNYTYNLVQGSGRYKDVVNGVGRYYFPMRDIEMLVSKVLYDRDMMIDKYGRYSYNLLQEKNKCIQEHKNSFWLKAEYV